MGRKRTQSYLDGLQIGRRIVKCRARVMMRTNGNRQFSIMRLVATSYTIRSVPSRREHIGWPDTFAACSQREIHFVFRKSDHFSTAPLARNAGVTQDGDHLRHHRESFTCRSGALMSANNDPVHDHSKQQNSVQSVSVVLMLDWYRNIGRGPSLAISFLGALRTNYFGAVRL